jgi:hypothetical protein
MIGTKSGIRSIGLKAQPIIRTANTFAYQGTLGSFAAKEREYTSLLRFCAFSFHEPKSTLCLQ